MDQQWEFDRVDLAPLPFEEYGPSHDQTYLDEQLPADPLTFTQDGPYFGEDLMMMTAPIMEMSPALQHRRSGNPLPGHRPGYGRPRQNLETQVQYENEVPDNAPLNSTSYSYAQRDYSTLNYALLANDALVYNNISVPGQLPIHHDHAVNDVSSLFETSSALECLRANSPARDLYGTSLILGRTTGNQAFETEIENLIGSEGISLISCTRHAVILESFNDHLYREAQEAKIAIDDIRLNTYPR
ncbi:hypothetical protein KCU95_g16279, partial [Aureobasidium melanogenum]